MLIPPKWPYSADKTGPIFSINLEEPYDRSLIFMPLEDAGHKVDSLQQNHVQCRTPNGLHTGPQLWQSALTMMSNPGIKIAGPTDIQLLVAVPTLAKLSELPDPTGCRLTMPKQATGTSTMPTHLCQKPQDSWETGHSGALTFTLPT